MTVLFNDPARFTEDMLDGFAAAHRDTVRLVPGGVVRRTPGRQGKVAVVVGGGSGHYPAFCGLVGTGLADGAVVGNVFTSPSAQQAISVVRAAHSGGGVVLSYGNYAGDVINFGLAQDALADEGIRTRTVLVTDDVASAPPEESGARRGVAGDFTVFKVLAAAAEEGLDLDEVVAAGERANVATRSLGVAFGGCTMPGASGPLFTVPDGLMGLGMGIHGEPGIRDVPLVGAVELAEQLVTSVLAETPPGAGPRVAVVLNGLGRTKYEELFVLYRSVDALLTAHGLTVVEPEVGELVTSLDMAGCSLTVMFLDADLERWWRAPAAAVAYRKGASPVGDRTEPAADATDRSAGEAVPPGGRGPAVAARPDVVVVPAGSAGIVQGRAAAEALAAVLEVLVEHEAELADLDAVAGDGDHGRGMVKGARAAVAAADQVVADRGDAPTVLVRAGEAWAATAGGTSGVLWGAGLAAFGRELPPEERPGAAHLLAGAEAFLAEVQRLGKARPGDKTMVDALVPFVAALAAVVQQDPETGAADAWLAAVPEAERGARATAGLRPRLGRARPLAERSVGTPDPGATSTALVLRTIGEAIARVGQEEDA